MRATTCTILYNDKRLQGEKPHTSTLKADRAACHIENSGVILQETLQIGEFSLMTDQTTQN